MVRVMEVGGWVNGVTAIVCIELMVVRSVLSYYVCGTCVYTKYLSYTYVLCYSIQEMEFVVFCNRYLLTYLLHRAESFLSN